MRKIYDHKDRKIIERDYSIIITFMGTPWYNFIYRQKKPVP